MAVGAKEYIETVTYLSKMYDYFNEKLFRNGLEKPVLTIHPDEKNKAYGWITQEKLWKENADDEGMYEINLSAQFLNRPISEIAATLIHEMCHQWAKANHFQDTARFGSFHNKLFRQIAESHGLHVELSRGRGWSVTTLEKSTEGLLQTFIEQNPEKPVYRVMPIKVKRVRNIGVRKYVCPECEASVRATKAVKVICGNCIKDMQEEKI